LDLIVPEGVELVADTSAADCGVCDGHSVGVGWARQVREGVTRMSSGAFRRLLAAAALVGLTLAVTAPTGQAASPKQDSVTGTAQHLGADPPFPVIQVRIQARSDATGTDPRGHMVVEAADIHSYRARVTCLHVVGNEATVGIEILKSTDPALEGQGELWSVVDGGSGQPDRIAGYEITPTPPTVCPPLSFNVPVISGDYVVHDASA